MSVAGHLDIQLDEYDQRIRTFVPWYEDMIEVAAGALLRDAGLHPEVLWRRDAFAVIAARR